MPADLDHERFRQVKLVRDPRPDQGADESESRGHDEPAAGPAGDRLANCATDGRDDDEDEDWDDDEDDGYSDRNG